MGVEERNDGSTGIRNVRVNHRNMVFATGRGTTYKRKELSLGSDMYAVTDIGRFRPNQEDAVLLMTHPKNDRFKMMVVADGMGGGNCGEEASAIAVDLTKKWFEALNEAYFSNVKDIKFKKLIVNIDKTICDTIGVRKGGTTFVCAIIGKDDTVIANVGDSRAYSVSSRGIEQITQDDSVISDCLSNKLGLDDLDGELKDNISSAYELFKAGRLKRDDIRFLEGVNVITASLGDGEYFSGRRSVSKKTIKNSEYSSLILCSDGVHDCISDEQLLCICRETPREEIAKRIAAKALKATSYVRDELRGEKAFVDSIQGGKDNTTVAVYDRPQKKGIRDFIGSVFGDRGR